MSTITGFRMRKGSAGEKSLELEVKLPSPCTEETFQEALVRAEYLLDNWIGAGVEATPQVPAFNPDDLMKHEGWKGKKTGPGEYAKGALAWGWNFADKFSKEVLTALEKGPVTIDQYEFSLNKEQTLVSTKKKKESAK